MKKQRPGQRNGYKPPLGKCSVCKQKARIFQKKGKKNYCRKCYKTPRHRCALCHKIRVINYIDPKTGYICLDCYERPKAVCSICKKVGEIVLRTKDNKLICRKCYEPPAKECSSCFDKRPLAMKNPALCHNCYGRYRRNGDCNYRRKRKPH